MKIVKAKLQKNKPQHLEIPASATVTKLVALPTLVNGKVELHWHLPDGSKLSLASDGGAASSRHA